MKISEAIVAYLEELRVQRVFGVPAGTTGAMWDSLNDSNIKPIINKHEAHSVYSATNYADISRKIGVCMLAGGVGVANGFNGIADAQRRGLPVLIISGYAQTSQMGKGAIQEYDTSHLSSTEFVENAEEFIGHINNAVYNCIYGHAPTQLIVPMDIQLQEVNISRKEIADWVKYLTEDDTKQQLSDRKYKEIGRELLDNKGIIFVGKGAYGCKDKIIELSDILGWHIIETPEAKGIVPLDYEYNLGTYGFYGTDIATEYVENSNFTHLLVLGTSLGEAETRNFNEVLTKDKEVIQVINKGQQSNTERVTYTRVDNYLTKLLNGLSKIKPHSKKRMKTHNNRFNRKTQLLGRKLSVQKFITDLPRIMDTDTLISCDIGEYMNFVYKYLEIRGNNKFLSSINYGSMGVMLGGSVGTALAHDGITTVICGDGSFFMNGMEILTAKQYRLPIVYFVINNAMLGYVEHGQKFIYGRSINGVVQDRVSIAKVAKSMGIRSYSAKTHRTLNDIIRKIKENYDTNGLNEPIVVEIITDGTEVLANADRFKALKGENK